MHVSGGWFLIAVTLASQICQLATSAVSPGSRPTKLQLWAKRFTNIFLFVQEALCGRWDNGSPKMFTSHSPETCEYVTLHGSRNSADVLKVLSWERSLDSPGGPGGIRAILIKGGTPARGGRRGWRNARCGGAL